MKLRAQKELVALQFYRFDYSAVGRYSRQNESCVGKSLSELVVELVSVAVSLRYVFFAVTLVKGRAFLYVARITAEPHRAAFRNYSLLVGHKVYYFIFRVFVELTRNRAV